MEENNLGWIKLHRCLLHKAAWQLLTAEQKNVMIVCLLLASHDDNNWMWQGKAYTIKPGQFITSLPKLSSTAGCSVQSARSALTKLKKLGFLTDESTGKGRLVTITNWAFYQGGASNPTDYPTDSQQTANRLPNRQPTDYPTPIKKKECKEGKKERTTKAFVKPTAEEVRAYCTERNNGIDADTFIDFYESRGWMVGKNHMKDWKAAVRNWEHRRKEDAHGSTDRGQDPVEDYHGTDYAQFMGSGNRYKDGPFQ